MSTTGFDRRRWWISFALFVAIGTVWALSSPVMSTPDEPAHVIKAVATAHGVLDGPLRVVRSPSPRVPSGTWTLYTETVTEAELGRHAHCYAFRPTVPAGCLEGIVRDTTPALVRTQEGQYPPLYYAMVGWPSRFALSPEEMVRAMRMVAVLVCGALLASGLTSAIGGSVGPAAVAGAVAAITPTVFFMIGAVNPSGLELAAAFCLWLSLLRLLHDDGPPEWHLLARVGIAAVLLAWSRPLSPGFAVAIAVAVLITVARRTRLAELWSRTPVRVAAISAGVLAALALAYLVAAGSLNSFTGFAQPGLTHLAAAKHSVGRLPLLARDLVGVFGWEDTRPPGWFAAGWILCAIGLAALALVVGSWRQRLAIVGTALGTIAVQVASEAVKAPSIGYVWQARYSLPLAMGVPILSGWVVATSPRVRRRAQLVVAAVVSSCSAFVLVVDHAVWMRRNMTGVAHPLLSYLSGHGWHPPLPAWVLGASMLVLAMAYAAWTLWIAASATEPDAASQPLA